MNLEIRIPFLDVLASFYIAQDIWEVILGKIIDLEFFLFSLVRRQELVLNIKNHKY